MNPAAILTLISNLYEQNAMQVEHIQKLEAQIAERDTATAN